MRFPGSLSSCKGLNEKWKTEPLTPRSFIQLRAANPLRVFPKGFHNDKYKIVKEGEERQEEFSNHGF